MTSLLEDKGLRIYVIKATPAFEACMLTINDNPAIIIQEQMPPSKQRFNLAHELGHLILKPAPDLDSEVVAKRFAGAFLLTKEKLISELGSEREQLFLGELNLIAGKYGINIEELLKRAGELDIISDQFILGA